MNLKNILASIWELAKVAIVAAIIVAPVRFFVFQPFLIDGQSMEPNFENHDYLIIDELSYHFRQPQRGEVIVFKAPNDLTKRYIKRIIGLPGETVLVKNGEVIVYPPAEAVMPSPPSIPYKLRETGYLSDSLTTPGEAKVKLNEGEYFVLGDNRVGSYDSRYWGSVPKANIIGRALLRLWPITAAAKMQTPVY